MSELNLRPKMTPLNCGLGAYNLQAGEGSPALVVPRRGMKQLETVNNNNKPEGEHTGRRAIGREGSAVYVAVGRKGQALSKR